MWIQAIRREDWQPELQTSICSFGSGCHSRISSSRRSWAIRLLIGLKHSANDATLSELGWACITIPLSVKSYEALSCAWPLALPPDARHKGGCQPIYGPLNMTQSACGTLCCNAMQGLSSQGFLEAASYFLYRNSYCTG